jgi:hypothetical protein
VGVVDEGGRGRRRRVTDLLTNFRALSGWDARRNFGLTAGYSVEDMEVVTALEVGLIDGAPAYIFVVDDSGLTADAS